MEDVEAELEIEARGELVRVRWISDDGGFIGLEFRGGRVASASSAQPSDFNVGDVAVLDGSRLSRVPSELWPEDSFVAVVRLKAAETTILDSSGQLTMVPTSDDVEYELGNTVEARTTGVVRVLSHDPISRFDDVTAVDDAFVEQFIYPPDANSGDFEDFGGNQDVVKRAKELIKTILKRHDMLVAIGARPIKGVLFTGDPGTGKTMLARIISAHADATFYKISGPEVVSKWVGQSEEILRRIFEHASHRERAIIFFDEIDSVAAQRAEDAHESSKRFVAQLLTLMDGFTSDRVVVIATTNRKQDMDAALRRAGRFDWEIEFLIPATRDERESVLVVAGRKMKAEEGLPHAEIADRTSGWTAADLASVWREAAVVAVNDGRVVVSVEDYIGGYQRMARRRQRGGSIGIVEGQRS